jgi:Cdc6-like AAA superfamily ATPase
MDVPRTNEDWFQLEIDVGRLFSAAPLSPASSFGEGPPEELYPGRGSEVHRMMRAVRDPAKHILLYGERGIGKTSLANTFWKNQAAVEHPTFAARVQVYPLDDFSSLWSRALEEFRTACQRHSQEMRTEVCSNFPHVSPDIVRREFQKLPQGLTAIMIVDEFDLLRGDEARELTANLLKCLHDNAVNVTVLLIGVAENVEELITDHQSLRRVLSLIKLERMNTIDLNNIVDARLRLTPLELSEDARSEIVTLSCGLPYYVQTLAKFAALNAIRGHRIIIGMEDINSAIENFLIESGQSFYDDYTRATCGRQPENIFPELILASALARAESSGDFDPTEVLKVFDLISPGKNRSLSQIRQSLARFASEPRGKILSRRGAKNDYRYRFSDALMQPFIVLRAIKDTMIDATSRQLLFHSSKAQFRDDGCRLGAAEAEVAGLGIVAPTCSTDTGDERPGTESEANDGGWGRIGIGPASTSIEGIISFPKPTKPVVREASSSGSVPSRASFFQRFLGGEG